MILVQITQRVCGVRIWKGITHLSEATSGWSLIQWSSSSACGCFKSGSFGPNVEHMECSEILQEILSISVAFVNETQSLSSTVRVIYYQKFKLHR